VSDTRNVRGIQDTVAELLTKAIEGLPQGSTKEELREAVETALKGHPEVGPLVTIENDDSEAGFRVRIELKLVPAPKTDINLN
jgi:hypothetical protein